MTQQFEVLALPFLACLILTGIHAYLGIHVLSRKVIFVDIALAQIAALGATVGFLLGYDPRSEGAYWFSLGFAIVAAAIFALTRTRVERVPQEAIIGLTYAVASAAAILLADISPHGSEHLKDLMAGSIVWVTPQQILKTGILYSLIGLFHFLFRRTFLLISMNPEEAYARGIRVRFWDFLFYLSFGVVITSSVQIAGVLLVFCYLVAPAVFAFMFSPSLRVRLALGWTVGTVVSALGLLFSYDRPSGPTIMVCFALVLVLGGLVRGAITTASRQRGAALLSAAVALAVIAGYSAVYLIAPTAITPHEHSDGSTELETDAGFHELGSSKDNLRLALKDSHSSVRVAALERLAAQADHEALPLIEDALEDPAAAVRESAAAALRTLGNPDALPALLKALMQEEEDEWVLWSVCEATVLMGGVEGIPALMEVARDGEARIVRSNALGLLRQVSGLEDWDGARTPDDLMKVIERWWQEHGNTLQWDPDSGTYSPHAIPDRREEFEQAPTVPINPLPGPLGYASFRNVKRILPWALAGAAVLIAVSFSLLGTRVSADSLAVVESGRPEKDPTILQPGFHLRAFGSTVTHYPTLPVTISGEAQTITAGGGEMALSYHATCSLNPDGFARHHSRLKGGSLEELCSDDLGRVTREQISRDASTDLLTQAFLGRIAEATNREMTRSGYAEVTLSFDRPDHDAILAAAVSLARRGEAQRLQEVVSAEVAAPGGSSSWKLITAQGLVHESRREVREAEKRYLDAVAIEPVALPPMSQLVALYSTVGEWQKLSRVLDAALAASPQSLRHINWLAMTFLRLEDYLAAEEILLQGIEIQPGNSTMLSNLGGIYLKSGRTDEALIYLQRAVDANPSNPQALFNLGAALAAERRYEEALPHLEAAEQTGRINSELLRTLAIVHEELGSPESASSYRNRLRQMEADRAGRPAEAG